MIDLDKARGLAGELVRVLEGEEPADPETIDGSGLRELRERADLTLRQVSARMDISHTYLWQIETGRTKIDHGKARQLVTFYESIIAARSGI